MPDKLSAPEQVDPHAPHIELKPLMGASFLFGTLFYYGGAVVLEGWPNVLHQEASTWGWVALMVAFPTLAAFILFNAALQRAPASQVNILIAAELGFTVVFLVFTVIGSAAALEKVINFSDSAIFLMSIPNIIGLYLMARVIRREIHGYYDRVQSGEVKQVADHY